MTETPQSDTEDAVRIGGWYRTEDYGEVRVRSIKRKTMAANSDGVVDELIIVTFNTSPRGAATREDMRTCSVDNFIGQVQGELQDDEEVNEQ